MKTTKNNPWAAMDAIVNANPEPMGEEWFTVEQYAERYKCPTNPAYNRLMRMKDAGLVERWAGVGGANKRLITKWRARPVSCHS